ncbi:protein of unknown function [Acidithiobacillus ferrivorans]|uniref:Uncharacterized protein n=1 Tax=Acidithiobacillus ferrivorans TaxID=160808 RepID=A0ABY1MPK8_9PROT|nr:protein of unknown function [Acidithiobacillus ferrivorans]
MLRYSLGVPIVRLSLQGILGGSLPLFTGTRNGVVLDPPQFGPQFAQVVISVGPRTTTAEFGHE